MIKAVLDSSAVLAYMQDEFGASVVDEALGDVLISSVNLTEVLTKLVENGSTFASAVSSFAALEIPVADFTRDLAEDAAEMSPQAEVYGLSLGDRACLALARRERLPVMTTDRAWRSVDVGVEIQLIR